MATYYFSASIDEFVSGSTAAILGSLTANSQFNVDLTQRDAWTAEIAVLKSALSGLEGRVFLEYVVPRIGSRIDAVVIVGGTILVLEFKVGATRHHRDDLNQVWDYALDLKNFHEASHQAPIIPILIATDAAATPDVLPIPHADGVYPPIVTNGGGLESVLRLAMLATVGSQIDAVSWGAAPYRPTPTIIEAAQALFAGHSVESIARSEAGAENLERTTRSVETAIELARSRGRKTVIFLTGVPGAGKTLVGLDIATRRRDAGRATHAVFLSGNGPLVDVLRAALKRDAKLRATQRNARVRRGDIAQEVKAFIQNVHHFRDEGINHRGPPADHIVIFDEAQRAWNLRKTADFMKRRKGHPDFAESEPEFLLSCLDRHDDWAAVICLVGGGQEINDGEAGIGAWLEAVRDRFTDWDVYISPTLAESEYSAADILGSLRGRRGFHEDASFHLATSVRSFRAENVSNFVKAVLDCDRQGAEQLLGQMDQRYPLAVTRNLDAARAWIRRHARGSERCGLLASSGAQRLRPHAIDVRVTINPVHWFLHDSDDVRSSDYLEDAATEFQVQGLEVDWTCVTWDADLRFDGTEWHYRSFRGSQWQHVRKPDRQQYLRNAYRVLLTRARQGMVIFVPPGSDADPTRTASFYDGTYQYLVSIGLQEIAYR